MKNEESLSAIYRKNRDTIHPDLDRWIALLLKGNSWPLDHLERNFGQLRGVNDIILDDVIDFFPKSSPDEFPRSVLEKRKRSRT